MIEWINVNDRLPEVGKIVLTCCYDDTVFVAYLNEGDFSEYGGTLVVGDGYYFHSDTDGVLDSVTHWAKINYPDE